MWWVYHVFFPFLGFCFVLMLALVLFFTCRALAFRRYGGWRPTRRNFADAQAILKRRLASGEISESDYERLKELLHQ